MVVEYCQRLAHVRPNNGRVLPRCKKPATFCSSLYLLRDQRRQRWGMLSSRLIWLCSCVYWSYNCAPQVVRRAVQSVDGLDKIDNRITIHLLTTDDKVVNFQHLTNIKLEAVPQNFQPSKARFKARSLEWFRLSRQFSDFDWVLHLDEETILDQYALSACINFIERTTFQMGQVSCCEHFWVLIPADLRSWPLEGIIFFNSYNYWRNPLLTVADASRAADDLGRFHFLLQYMHSTLRGLHGSFILLNGQVENAVTWNTDCLVEDYWFGLQVLVMRSTLRLGADGWQARALGFSCGWIPAIAREQSAQNLSDWVLQRRRWFSGIWQLNSVWAYPEMFGGLCLIIWFLL